MKTHAPESRRKNTPKPTVKQGKNPSQFGQNGESDSRFYRNPNHAKSLRWTSDRLEEAISANYALTSLIQDSINIQYYEGEKTHSDHGQKMSHGIQALFRSTNCELEYAMSNLRAVIAGKFHGGDRRF